LDADAEVAHAYEKVGLADDVSNSGRDAGVDLSGAEDGWVWLVVEGYEEDVGYDWRGG
jgi:hypothetical protein